MATVKLGHDVRRHLDAVDHQVAAQPVDHRVLHHHLDQPIATQIAFAELGTCQVLILESRHAGQYPPANRHPACHALGVDSSAVAADPPAAHSDDRRQREQNWSIGRAGRELEIASGHAPDNR
jgi:hypothetical protein